ncbi:MAG: LysE family translocator [Spirochaetales bacterium]|nr:LysE family translocator [Spirochaetales bacterium]
MIDTYWIVFISAAVILNISPGPDMIYLISQSMSSGKKVGFASVLGLGSGALLHTLFISLGISAIIATSITVFRVMKIIGAAYLFYLGAKALIFGEIDFSDLDKKNDNKSFLRSYLNAIIIDVTNPKVAIFFMAFLPQFYRENGSSQISQFMLLGTIIVLIGFVIESLIVLLSEKIALVLRKKPIISKLIDKLFGTILISLGIKLILEKQN